MKSKSVKKREAVQKGKKELEAGKKKFEKKEPKTNKKKAAKAATSTKITPTNGGIY